MNKPLVVITGASGGIGTAMAKAFSHAGYPICLLARNLDSMEKLNLSNSICLSVDVTDSVAFKEAVLKAEDKFGPVDLLCNNAGFVKAGDFVDIAHEMNENLLMFNVVRKMSFFF